MFRVRNAGLRKVLVADLADAPWNHRTHPQSQQEALDGAIDELGFYSYPDVYEAPGGILVLIDGHLRKSRILARYGPDAEIEVNVTDFDEAEAKKANLTKDPLAAMAETNAANLDQLLRECQTGSEALAKMLSDIASGAGCEWAKQVEVVEDEVPEPPVDPVTNPGDLWLLGEHRLLCGDSTQAEDVCRVLDGEKASCIFTDPPYGVSIAAKNRTLNKEAGGKGVRPSRNESNITDDDLSPEELEQRLLPAFVNVRELMMADDCALFVCSPQGGSLGMMMMMMQNAGLRARHVLIWVKNQPTFSMGRLDYDYQHEPILLTWLKRHKRPMKGEHRTTVWRINRPRSSSEHPTMKPVELYANAYLNNSDPGDTVADPYAGSGTAFIAAEQLGRRCFGIEISPVYCDVIVKRWEKLTGRKAELNAQATTSEAARRV